MTSAFGSAVPTTTICVRSSSRAARLCYSLAPPPRFGTRLERVAGPERRLPASREERSRHRREWRRLSTVSDEVEAETVLGTLPSAGIECGYRVTERADSRLHGFAADGPREILVHPDDLVAAQTDTRGGA